MFSSLKAYARAAALAAVMAIGMASGAHAAIININPGDSKVLTYGDMFWTKAQEKSSNASFTDVYSFFLPEQGGPIGIEQVFYSYDVNFPVPSGAAAGIGIRNLTFTVKDITNNNILNVTTLTNANGVVLPGFQNGFNFTGFWQSPIDLTLTVTGKALSNGGSYEAIIAAVSTVPVPAPLVLLLSALLGLGYLGNRRKLA